MPNNNYDNNFGDYDRDQEHGQMIVSVLIVIVIVIETEIVIMIVIVTIMEYQYVIVIGKDQSRCFYEKADLLYSSDSYPLESISNTDCDRYRWDQDGISIRY